MRKLSLMVGVLAASVCFMSAASSQAAGVKSGQQFGDWTVNCEGKGAGEICHIDQKIVSKDEKKHGLLEIGVGMMPMPNGTKSPKLIVLAPLGILLPKGLTLQIDDTPAAQLPFVQCFPVGCRTVINLESDGLQKFKNGNTAKFTYYLPNGKPASIPVSLKGFTAGFDAVSK